MNYGKNNSRKRETELTSKAPMIRKKFHVIFCKALLICFFAAVIIGGSTAFGIFKGIIDSAPAIDELDTIPTGYLTTVLDTDGKEIATLVATGSHRVYVKLDEIPKDLQHAFVAIEDERFYDHNGIDLKGIIRAGISGIRAGSFREGASTITQQLLKNTVLAEVWASETSFIEKLERKIQEQYLAIQLEKKVSKDWIMENYLNAINLSQNTLGVQVASQRYFGKDVSELTLSECTVLAAITQNPSRYDPIINPEQNAERRKKVLEEMLIQEWISKEEYDEALADNVYDRIQIVNIETEDEHINTYFVDELTDQVYRALIEQKGYTETQAYKAIYQGGLTICSTQDSALQAICDEEVANPENYPADPKISFSYRVSIRSADGTIANYSDQTMLYYYRYANKNYGINFATEEEAAAAIEQYKAEIMKPGDTIVEGSESIIYTIQPQLALTVIDQTTGEVKAIVGGRGSKTASKTLNRATNTTRQPGSTFKIVSCYAPALDAGGLTLASVQDDAPFQYSDLDKRAVNNYDFRFRGFTTIREAITHSINIVTVKNYVQISPRLGYNYVCRFGINTVSTAESDNQSLCLGGLTDGVTNLELTAAYATIANNGVYIKPKFFTKILDHDGNVLIDNTAPESQTVLKESTAWLITDAMEDVMTSGTGTSAYFGASMPQAGKSGTTTANKDSLFAGFTPYYTCVVWGGFDDNSDQAGTQTGYTKRIWKAVMSRIHENLEIKNFTKPDGIVTAQVCSESGKLPIEGVCDADPRGSRIITEYFAGGTVPTEYCDHHMMANVCSVSGSLAGSYCPAEALVPRVFVIGGSVESEDGPYLLTEEMLSQICTMHNESNSTLNGNYIIPTIPGLNNMDPTAPNPNPNQNPNPDPAAGADPANPGQTP